MVKEFGQTDESRKEGLLLDGVHNSRAKEWTIQKIAELLRTTGDRELEIALEFVCALTHK